jgi:hypothetical protein
MILYVNGDSHTAAAEAVNSHAFAVDDGQYFYLGRAPHPENFAVSWGKRLAAALRCGVHCDAESASSNSRILRTTRDWLENNTNSTSDTLVIIQWSTWEREEWLHDNVYYQVGSSGIDHVPQELQEKYKNYIIGTDWKLKTEQAHKEIWELHQELTKKNIKHIFFNGNNDFSAITDRKDWGINYMDPYDPAGTYSARVIGAGINTVAPNSWHFGADGHAFWNQCLLKYIIQNCFI